MHDSDEYSDREPKYVFTWLFVKSINGPCPIRSIGLTRNYIKFKYRSKLIYALCINLPVKLTDLAPNKCYSG